MEVSQQLANRLREVILNGTWIANTNFKHQLSDITWLQANMKIGNLNTISILTFHIHYYIKGMLHVFEGGTLNIRDKYSFDAPVITSQTDWETLLNTFWRDAEKYAQHVENMSEEQLSSFFVEEKYGTYIRGIEGMIEHSYYHLGQIVMIKNLIKDSENL